MSCTAQFVRRFRYEKMYTVPSTCCTAAAMDCRRYWGMIDFPYNRTSKHTTISFAQRPVAAVVGDKVVVSFNRTAVHSPFTPSTALSPMFPSSHAFFKSRSRRCVFHSDTLLFLSLFTNPSRPITYSCIDSPVSYPQSSRPVQALAAFGCGPPSSSSTLRDLFLDSFRSIHQYPQNSRSEPQLASLSPLLCTVSSLHSPCGPPNSPSAS